MSEVEKALEAVCEELSNLDFDDFFALLDKHKDGNIATALLDLDEFSRSKYYKEVFKGGTNE